jgi:inhibitor of KinA
MDWPKFLPVAAHAVLVEFNDHFAPASQDQILGLDRALQSNPCAGFVESVPALVNILIVFDPVITDHARVIAHLKTLIGLGGRKEVSVETHTIPICYDPMLAQDLNNIAQQTNLSPDAVINAHLGGKFSVAMYGFAPGYAYLSGLPAPLQLDRKTAPLRGIAAGSVIIAGAQCLITTLTMPTGWWIIGRSPARILTGDPARPFLFNVGDQIRFQRITLDAFHAQTACQP